ncbi:hypothetical protein ACFLQR_04440 [Verrucomicrobiota bacterium]
MKKGTLLIIIGIAVAVGGPLTGLIVSRANEARAAAAFRSGAPPETSAHHMRIVMIAEIIGYTACFPGLALLTVGVVTRKKHRHPHAGPTEVELPK